MKKLWMMIALAMVLGSCSKKSEKCDLSQLHLYGDVKSVEEKVYSAEIQEDGSVRNGAMTEHTKSIFNKQGYFTEVIKFDPDGGDTLEVIRTVYDDDNLVSEKFKTDVFGRMEVHSFFTYDSLKSRIKTIRYEKEDGTVRAREVFNYNDDNNIKTVVLYNEGNEIIRREEVQNDKNGLPSNVKIYNEKNELVNCRKETYDQQKNLIGFIVYSADEVTPVLQVKMDYDKSGNMVKQEAVDFQEHESFETVTNKYIFDKKMNWTKQMQYIGNVASVVTEREIEYY